MNNDREERMLLDYLNAVNAEKRKPRTMLTREQMDACVGKTIANLGHPAGLPGRLSISFDDGTYLTFEALDLPNTPHPDDRCYIEVKEETITKEK